ncbi:MAG: putative metal-dependent hydrolase [Acidobacteria bacterium]|nr:putative metal-dependent hydrolase [Acidobacteriota bacterium]
MDDPRFPIGKFTAPSSYTAEGRAAFIRDIESMPGQLRVAVRGLSRDQLNAAYREGGWSLAQVVHHLADSHMNAYLRFKLTATADNPTVVGYDEAAWARFPDAVSADIEVSLSLLDAVHARWVVFLKSLPPESFERTFNHSAMGPMALNRVLALYAWHGRPHTAHITGCRARNGW